MDVSKDINTDTLQLSVSQKNSLLFDELSARGYYVQQVGQIHAGEIDYIIVSCATPKDGILPIDEGNSN